MAIRDFTRAIDLYREMDGDIYFELSCNTARIGRGIAYERIGEYYKAIDDLTWRSPEHSITEYMGATAYIARAVAYSRTGAYRKAIDDFDKARIYVDFSMDADAYFARGYAYAKISNEDEGLSYYKNWALSDYQSALALAQDDWMKEQILKAIDNLQ